LKVDRTALPAPDAANMAGHADYVAPRSPLEWQLRAICSEVMGIEHIGVNDDLFALGADSLVITRIRNRLVSTLSLELPVAMLFDRPSIAELASEIEKSAGPADDIF
jgi:acyl carrier protein